MFTGGAGVGAEAVVERGAGGLRTNPGGDEVPAAFDGVAYPVVRKAGVRAGAGDAANVDVGVEIGALIAPDVHLVGGGNVAFVEAVFVGDDDADVRIPGEFARPGVVGFVAFGELIVAVGFEGEGECAGFGDGVGKVFDGLEAVGGVGWGAPGVDRDAIHGETGGGGCINGGVGGIENCPVEVGDGAQPGVKGVGSVGPGDEGGDDRAAPAGRDLGDEVGGGSPLEGSAGGRRVCNKDGDQDNA